MKKTIATFLLVCLLLPMLLFSFNTTEKVWDIMFPKQVAQASTVRTTPYGSNFLQHYFYNLRSNLGNNIAGTCGYVAVGMLLSYYDTFWDDDIVPEEYETTAAISSLSDYDYNSPGAGESGHSLATCGYALNYDDLYGLFLHLGEQHGNELYHDLPYVDDTLHGELIARGINFADEFETNDLRSVAAPVAKLLVDDYLLSYAPNSLYANYTYTNLFGVTDPAVLIETSNQTRERIISKVTSNIPVAVYMGSTTNWLDRHVAIAYDYDTTNDVLYFHMGRIGSGYYFPETSQMMYPKSGTDNTGTRYYYGELALINNGTHNHSNNFILDSGESVCSCQLADHEHKYSYATYSVDQHKKFCHCGYQTLQNHVYRLNGLKYICQYCKRIHTGTTPPITPVTPPTSIEDGDDTTDWLGVDVVNMEVPYYEE